MMRRQTLLTASAVALCLGMAAPTVVLAQGAQGFPGRAGGQGGGRSFRPQSGMMIDPSHSGEATLLGRVDVWHELMLTGSQQEQVGNLLQQQRQEMQGKLRDSFMQARQQMQNDGQDPNSMTPEDRRAMFQKMQQQMQDQMGTLMDAQTGPLEAILTSGQVQRLQQLDLQRRGALAASDPKVAASLNLTNDQTTRIKALLQEFRTAQSAAIRAVMMGMRNTPAGATQGNNNGGPPPDPNQRPPFDPAVMQARMQEAQKAADKARQASADKVIALFTPAQKQQWKALLGRPFTFEPGDSSPDDSAQ